MDWLAFIAEIVKAVAWPAAIVTIIVLLKRPISQLIPTIQKLKYKDLAVEFGRKVEEAAVEAGESLPPPRDERLLQPANLARLKELSKSSPRVAVLEAWLEVESAALEFARNLNLRLGNVVPRSPSQALRAIEQSRKLDEPALSTIADMRVLRNEAVHYPDFAITSESAMKYVQTAIALAAALRELGGAA